MQLVRIHPARVPALLSCILLMAPAGRSAAEEKPLWELGAGLGSAVVPDYAGSDEYPPM
jgi:hypothetical protein